jgi:mono/diheme cytochrome c family protein
VADLTERVAGGAEMKYFAVISMSCLIAVSLTTGCGTARKSEPLKGPLEIETEVVEKGQHVFMKHCNQCHPQGEAGVGPSLNDKRLVPRWLIKLQVRKGFGAMPAFKKEHISDEDLDELVSYIKKLQHH